MNEVFQHNSNQPESKSQYRVLALETRPQTLSALVGQDTVQKVLHDLLTKDRVPHALLFTGTRGTGKTTTARIFAKALCCVNGPTSEPCGVCVHCVGITASSHEDVLEIDGASNTGVDQIRELRESARFFPKSSRYKIFIIDEVHMLSIGAFNALLKTLEEPPPKVIFILATTEVTKVPSTVRSRCMVLPFKRVEVSVLAAHLESVLLSRNIRAETDALLSIAREARGSFRDGLSLVEQAIPFVENGMMSKKSVDEAFGVQDRDFAKAIFKGIVSFEIHAALNSLQEAEKIGLDFSRILQQTAEFFRHALVLKSASKTVTGSALSLLVDELLESERSEIMELSEHLSVSALTECFRILQQGLQDLSKATQQKYWVEIAILDCIERSKWLDTEKLIQILSKGVSLKANVSPNIPAMPVKSVVKETSERTSQHSNPAAGNSNLNFQKLKEWIAVVAEKSRPLGAKLRHAHFEIFKETEVRLATQRENEILGAVSPADLELMNLALEKVGFAKAKIFGFHVEGNENQNLGNSQTSSDQIQKKKNLQVTAPGKNSLANSNAQNTPTLSTISSVSQFDNSEAQKDFELRKKKILDKPFFVKLCAAADRVEIFPSKSD